MSRNVIAYCARSISRFALALIGVYRFVISPWVGTCCRFEPTCSSYAKTAFSRFGPVRGLYLTLWRLLRCHPFFSGGYDPVPTARTKPNGHQKNTTLHSGCHARHNDVGNLAE